MDNAKLKYVLTSYPKLLGVYILFVVRRLFSPRENSIDLLERLTDRFVLPRHATIEDMKYLRDIVGKYKLPAWSLPLSFFRLPDKWEMKFLQALSLDKMHEARLHLVQTCLPPAERVLDLGGAVDKHPEGALLAMGYPHQPKEVVIVDLPDGERSKESVGKPLRDMNKDGTAVRFIFHDMSLLESIEDNSFDLVWSGQSIEHVTEAKAKKVFNEAHRVLRPGGYFCLDTPNRKLTSLVSKDYLHPDHKIEYEPTELIELAKKTGFQVESATAVTPLPVSKRLGRISKLEILDAKPIGNNPDTGFSFFLKCRKIQKANM